MVTQTIDGYTLLAFLPFLVVAPTLGLVLTRKFARPWLLLTLTIASSGAIIAVTIGGRMLKLTSWGRGDFVLSWLFDSAIWAHVLEPDRTWVMNAVLFIPAGCLLTLITPRVGIRDPRGRTRRRGRVGQSQMELAEPQSRGQSRRSTRLSTRLVARLSEVSPASAWPLRAGERLRVR